MLGDDLAGLFAPPQTGPGVGFRQGLVVSWNANTGANVINVAGTLITDTPMLNTGEAVALKAGHVVGLLTFNGSWFILGRITPPGDPNFAAASVAFGSAGAQSFNFTVPATTPATKASSSELVVPDWADEALVIVTGFCTIVNNAASPSGVLQSLAFNVGVNGGSGGAAPVDAPYQSYTQTSASTRNRITGLSGGETLQVVGQIATINGGVAPQNLAAHGANCMFVHAIAVYKSNI